MSTPTYRYGKVSGTFPALRVVTERTEPSGNRWVCCGYCSAQMAALTAKAGLSTLMKNEAHSMRAKGGRAHNSGSNARELRDGARAAIGVTLSSIGISDIPDRLRKGYAVVLSIQYSKLPSWAKVQANDFGHSVTLFGWQEADRRAGLFDPLWSQGASGAWIPWDDIKSAMWADGTHSTTTIRLVEAGEKEAT